MRVPEGVVDRSYDGVPSTGRRLTTLVASHDLVASTYSL